MRQAFGSSFRMHAGRKTRISLSVVLLVIAGLLLGSAASLAAPGEPNAPDAMPTNEEAELRARSRNIRTLLGFDAAEDRLAALEEGEASDEGVERYGFLFTVSELDEFELRMAIMEGGRYEAHRYAERLESFAGAYSQDGAYGFVIALVDPKPSEVAEIRSRFPYSDERLKIVDADVTYSALREATERVAIAYADDIRNGPLVRAGIDVSVNSVTVYYVEADPELFDRIRQSARVSVQFRPGVPSGDQICTSRANCNSEQRAGVQINGPGGSRCSSGFIVRTTTGNEMALTSGHCWFGFTSGTVNSGAAGFFGTLTGQNALEEGSPADARLIETANASSENWVYYAESLREREVGQAHQLYTDAALGDMVCVRAYVLQADPCGTVQSVHVVDYVTACDCFVNTQILANYDSAGGNSGGAVISPSGYTAVGVHRGAGSVFTHIALAEQELNVTVSTSS